MTTLPVARLMLRPRALVRLPVQALTLLLGGWGILGCMERPMQAPAATGAGDRTDAEVHGPR